MQCSSEAINYTVPTFLIAMLSLFAPGKSATNGVIWRHGVACTSITAIAIIGRVVRQRSRASMLVSQANIASIMAAADIICGMQPAGYAMRCKAAGSAWHVPEGGNIPALSSGQPTSIPTQGELRTKGDICRMFEVQPTQPAGSKAAGGCTARGSGRQALGSSWRCRPTAISSKWCCRIGHADSLTWRADSRGISRGCAGG